ncbi:hypothetical protein OAI46_06555 [Alphaproteobacteria bacterium]|nr:hypothetical protein [Alphaproteobacteria bacterium]MDC0148504.1 hypothetical protein [Alphaproteobacteria bacterium]
MSDWISFIGGFPSIIDWGAIIALSFLTGWRSRRKGRVFLLASFVGLLANLLATAADIIIRANTTSYVFDLDVFAQAIMSITLGRTLLFCLICSISIPIFRSILNQIRHKRLFS